MDRYQSIDPKFGQSLNQVPGSVTLGHGDGQFDRRSVSSRSKNLCVRLADDRFSPDRNHLRIRLVALPVEQSHPLAFTHTHDCPSVVRLGIWQGDLAAKGWKLRDKVSNCHRGAIQRWKGKAGERISNGAAKRPKTAQGEFRLSRFYR